MSNTLLGKSISILFLNLVRTLSFFLFYRLIIANFGITFSSQFAIIDSWVLLGTSIIAFGFNETVLRIFKDFQSSLKTFLIAYLKIFFSLILLVIPLIVIIAYNDIPQYSSYISIFILLNLSLFVVNSLLRSYNHVLSANLFDNIFPIFFLCSSFICISYGFNEVGIIYSWVISKAICLSIAILVLLSVFKNENFFQVNDNFLIKIIKIAFPIVIANFSIVALNEIPVIFLGFNSSSNDILSYKMGIKIASLMWFIQYSFYNVLSPIIPKLFKENKYNELHRISIKQTKNSAKINAIFFVIIIFFGKHILNLLSPQMELNHAPLFILTFALFLNSLFGPIGLLFQTTKFESEYMKVMSISLLQLLLFAYPVSYYYGALGMSILFLIIFTLRNLYCRYFLFKFFKQNFSII